MALKVGDEFVGFKVIAEIRKNKMASTQKQECELEMFYGKGFNPTSDLLADALEKEIIVKVGNTHYLKDEKLGGISKVRELMKDTEFVERLKLLL